MMAFFNAKNFALFGGIMFFKEIFTRFTVITIISLFMIACSDTNNGVTETLESRDNKIGLMLDVYKRSTCGCCKKWINHVKDYGFTINTHNKNDLSALKKSKGIAPAYQSCHTAVSKDGYVFEGHIPAKFVQRFLEEKPAGAIGLSVPRMPTGSPGMEVGTKFMSYQVLLLKQEGTAEPYAKMNSLDEQY